MWELLASAAAILTAITTAAGLFWSPLYRDAPYWTEQARGIDLATLFLAVPSLVVSLWLLRQGSAPAGAAAIGVLLYLVYNYVIYSISVAMNRLAFLYIAILGLCVWSLILHFLAPTAVPSGLLNLNSPLARVVGGFLVLVAALFGLLWLSQIAAATISGIPPIDVKRTGLPANPVYALDLAIYLPLAVVAAVGMFRGSGFAASFAVPMLFWLFLTSAGVLGGFLFASRAGEQVPAVIAVLIGLIGLVAIGLAGLAITGANKAVS
jgi:hypothetical protein